MSVCSELITPSDREIAEGLKGVDIHFSFQPSPTVKIYSKERLSVHNIVTLLSNFDIEVIDSFSYRIEGLSTSVYYFTISCDRESLETHSSLIATIAKLALEGKELLHCPLYPLVSRAGFDLDHIHFLRAMVKYLDQILPLKKERTIIKTLLAYPEVTKRICDHFFGSPFDPDLFNRIESSEDDRLFRIFLAAVEGVVTSNFSQRKETLSFKFDTARFKQFLPGLQPNIEIFVYHRDFIGVHLRASKVARGGIRYSDREDLREEVKSLMITQEAKNSIIIPSGAKGGFYIFKKPTREEFRHYYSLYIDSLLDVVDLDPTKGDDFYFVVAADRGTAAMSDRANEIAKERGFWLGDAFASGGSNGYSHKELGVTARGAWHSAARHFHQRGINIFTDPITVVGIGSMRGDVFGNGVLINPHIRLVAAISSQEIFIDPEPNVEEAYRERKRLFEEERSWREYNPEKISRGGGVFSRSAKRIQLTPEIQRLIATEKEYMSGEELARSLLLLPVDLLYIGGIGTYIKSSDESDIEISDKANAGVRVNAGDLRAYAVCEGGNLGLTQRGRIEYAKGGGKINLDHIDNSGGVHTSDYEVNLKIAIDRAIEEGVVEESHRSHLLRSLIPEVLEKVFQENVRQPFIMTIDQRASKNHLNDYLKAIEILEKEVEYFKRKDHSIPKGKDIEQVLDGEGALVRPVLGILLSYSKIFLKELLLQSDLIDEPLFRDSLLSYFPPQLVEKVGEERLLAHPLNRRIAATHIANRVIDQMGIRFISDYEELGRELFLVKVRAFLLLNRLLEIEKVTQELLAREFTLGEDLYEMVEQINESLEFNLSWMVRNQREIDPNQILSYRQEVAEFLGYGREWADNFFRYTDLLKFTMLAIYLKEQSSYTIGEILNLLLSIIEKFQIDRLLNYLYHFQPKSRNGREIKEQLILLVEYFVTSVAKEVVLKGRGVEEYLEEKMVDLGKLQREIERIQEDPNDLTYMVNIVHKLLLTAM
ncbi:MAG: NAD-glutamate dehydrogenase [Epsilonproteobacteria bacterium]|nr:glutamate dehydrogenase [Campylobacterota bacterium]NPA57149.1 NAD-glutamate dehydrogenase [Campylobacterota bacterium]